MTRLCLLGRFSSQFSFCFVDKVLKTGFTWMYVSDDTSRITLLLLLTIKLIITINIPRVRKGRSDYTKLISRGLQL